jgi:hypothetical protein
MLGLRAGGYAVGSFYKDAGVRDICAQHSHIITAERTLNHQEGNSIT